MKDKNMTLKTIQSHVHTLTKLPPNKAHFEIQNVVFVTDRPGPPEGPVETVETTSSIIEIKWSPPKDDGGSAVTNYIIERQQAGQSLWTKLGDVSADKTSFRDRNVTHGKKYNYRIYAENPEGLSDSLETADSIMAGIMSECRKKKSHLAFLSNTHVNLPQVVINENAPGKVF